MRKGMNVQSSEQNDRDRALAPEASSDLWATLLRAAWLAILLGLLMEVLLVALGGALGDVLGLRPLVADLVRSVSWSVFVCVGLAVGTAVARARGPLMGFLGLFSAPVAFEAQAKGSPRWSSPLSKGWSTDAWASVSAG